MRKAAEWHNRQILKGMRSGIVAPKKGWVTQDQRTGKGGVVIAPRPPWGGEGKRREGKKGSGHTVTMWGGRE